MIYAAITKRNKNIYEEIIDVSSMQDVIRECLSVGFF